MTRAVAPVLIPKKGQCIENTQCNTPVATAWRGTSPYHYQSGSFANGGAPPMGMIVDLNGNLKGKAPSQGDYKFSVCVVDVIGESDCGTSSVQVSRATTPTTSPTGVFFPDWLSGFLSGFKDIIGSVAGDLAGLIPLPDRYPGDSPPKITPSVTSTPAGCSGEYPYYYGGSCHSYPSRTPTPAITKGSDITGMCVASAQMGNCMVEFCSEMGSNGQLRGYYKTSRGNFYCSGSTESTDCVAAAQRMVQACF